MRHPEFSLKQTVTITSDNQEKVFLPGTLVHPFWNETLLPDHRLEQLKEATKHKVGNYVMCIIGIEWVAVEAEQIRKTEW